MSVQAKSDQYQLLIEQPSRSFSISCSINPQKIQKALIKILLVVGTLAIPVAATFTALTNHSMANDHRCYWEGDDPIAKFCEQTCYSPASLEVTNSLTAAFLAAATSTISLGLKETVSTFTWPFVALYKNCLCRQ
ncbi:MAG TPA: hypothetical protein VLG44_08025 [Chlamydiales bacterium]|nr:hypothetical protein [Chlamydiales bacterium]